MADSEPAGRTVLSRAFAILDTFTEVQWATMRGDLPRYPF